MKEYFDKIYAHALSMEKPAVNETGGCVYRGPNGPCLIGAIITDEEAKASEGMPIDLAFIRGKVTSIPNSGFFQDCQVAHDRNCRRPNWKELMLEELREIANTYGVG